MGIQQRVEPADLINRDRPHQHVRDPATDTHGVYQPASKNASRHALHQQDHMMR